MTKHLPIVPTAEGDPARGPISNTTRAGIALCLSGGGYRAALFHLGAMERLNERGLLSQVDTISTVSGGSILAGHFARLVKDGYAPKDGVYPDWGTVVRDPFLEFTSRDIRTLSFFMQFGAATNRGYAGEYYESLTRGLTLAELPTIPRFVFCATDIVFGKNWEMSHNRVGDYVAKYIVPTKNEWPVSRAMAASSCFPPAFLPIPAEIPADRFKDYDGTGVRPEDEYDSLREKIRLADGGVYDNLGLEPVWKIHATVLVSDGGATLQPEAGSRIARLMRNVGILQDQIGALRKRWLIDIYKRHALNQPDTFNGAYWGIMSATERYRKEPGYGYSKKVAAETIASIRTDLDPFSPNEAWVLMKHGYELADIGIETYVPTLATTSAPRKTWPAGLLDGTRVETALAKSQNRRYVRITRRHKADSLLK